MNKMKQTLLLLTAAFVVVFGFNSCKEDIQLSGNFTETAVVYGLLDQSESIHMIKITRAFIGPGNSLEISKIPDSSYFPNVSATVTERLSNGSIGREWVLYDSIVDTKETDGVFYAPEQRVYVFRSGSKDNSDSPTQATLLADATYNLKIVINEGQSDEFTVTGSTKIISGISTSTDAPNFQFKFANNAVTTGEYVSQPISVTNGDAAVLNTSILVTYSEFIGNDTLYHTFNWTLAEIETATGSSTNFAAQGESFYNLINSNAAATDQPGITKRNLEGLTIRVVGGSQDLYNYILINQPSSSLAQNKPTFTNLSATGDHPVLGIFSSRFTHSVYHPMSTNIQNIRCIDRNSTAELCIGPLSGTRLFCSQQQLDMAQSQPWACN